jgi:SSS family solute:Na+ symporter
MFATIGGFLLSVALKFLPFVMNLGFLSGFGFSTLVKQEDGALLYEIPFLDRMGFVFLICIIVMYIISKIDHARGVPVKGLEVDTKMFRVNSGFAAGSLIIVGILVALYTLFW